MESGVLYILESRTAQRSAQASVTAAVCMVKERIITEREALLRLDANQMDYFLHPVIDSRQCKKKINIYLLHIKFILFSLSYMKKI